MTEQSNVLGNSQASERRWPQMNEWMTELASLVCFPSKTINQHIRVGETWGMIPRSSSNLCTNIYSTYRDHSSFFRQKMLTFSKFLDFVHSFLHFIYWDRVSVHGPGYPVIHYVASMEFKRSVCLFLSGARIKGMHHFIEACLYTKCNPSKVRVFSFILRSRLSAKE